MAFPTVVNTNSNSSSAQSPAVSMPATIVAGRLLVIVARSAGSESPGGTISGFTKIADLNRSGGGSGTLCVFTKVAAGSDTATYSGSIATDRVFQSYQVQDWLGDVTGVKVATLGTGTAINPPNLDAVVVDDWLWLVFGSVGGTAGNSVTAAPTNYTDFLGPVTLGNVSMGSARRALNASSEDPGAFSGTAGTGPMTAVLAIPPPEVFGDITFNGVGAVAASATNPAVPHPAGIAADDLLLLIVGQKPATANGGGVTTPTDWLLAGSLEEAGGYATTLGVDTGNTNLFVYTKIATGSESGNLTVTTSDNSVAWGQMCRLSSSVADDWEVAVVTGSDTSAGSWSSTFDSDPGIETEDYVIGALCIPTDVTTPSQFSAQAFTATGVTFGTVREISEPDSSLGNDIGGMICRSRVLSGTSSAAPVMTATAGGTTTNVRGPAALVRVRRVSAGGPTPTGSFFPFFL